MRAGQGGLTVEAVDSLSTLGITTESGAVIRAAFLSRFSQSTQVSGHERSN
jgi:hypothetical protein